jgi:hypothetical protein
MAVVSNAIREMKALQRSESGIEQIASAYTTACEQLNRTREQQNTVIVETYTNASERDWLFLTSINGPAYDDITDYQRVSMLNMLKKNGGTITFSELVEIGVYDADDQGAGGAFSWLYDVPRNFILGIEAEYNAAQNGASFAEFEAYHQRQKSAMQWAMIAMTSYPLVISMTFGRSDVAINTDNKSDLIEFEIEGRGLSSGGHQPTYLKEQLAIKEAMSSPANGKFIFKSTDPRWPGAEGWGKYAQNVNNIEIHYQYNPITGQIDDFKIK